MSGNEIISFLGKDWTELQRLIREALSSDISLLQKVNDKLYSRAGKQLRPMVSLLMARACSADGRANADSCHFAAAAELLHNATLLHDDVADSGTIRRGMPTLSAEMGPTAAVLVGDYWLSSAVNTVLAASSNIKVIRLFARTLGDLAKGEMLQLQNAATGNTTEEDYFKVIYCKTASLFETAGVSGAVSVNASEQKLEAARRYASSLGTAFQIRDDILDYEGGEKLGKPMGVDLAEKKITLPLIGAFYNAPAQEKAIRRKITRIHLHPEYVQEIHGFVLENGGVDYAAAKLDEYVERAVGALEIFDDSVQKDYLVQIAQYNSYRKI
ncbi:MAG: polyprenyl synthetase family protein [Bacteroidales bacterium]|nr:polyprenyl synthetase family protein [Candidatus Cryptobacteroides fimicaballi]